jgi:hypothetical protein
MGSPQRLIDVTAQAPEQIPFPEVVANLEELGFVRLCRIQRVGNAAPEAAALAFREQHRELFLAHKRVPALALISPDRNTVVLVDWWWDLPEVRMRSVLADGSLVETWRAWERMPVLPRRLERARGLVASAEQRLLSAPRGGRSIDVCAGSAAEQWAMHQGRQRDWAAFRGSAVLPLATIADVLALGERVLTHDRRTIKRIGLRARLVVGAFAVALGLAVAFVAAGNAAGLLVACLVATVAAVVLTRTGDRSLRYADWLRPTFAPRVDPSRPSEPPRGQ